MQKFNLKTDFEKPDYVLLIIRKKKAEISGDQMLQGFKVQSRVRKTIKSICMRKKHLLKEREGYGKLLNNFSKHKRKHMHVLNSGKN